MRFTISLSYVKMISIKYKLAKFKTGFGGYPIEMARFEVV